MIYRDRSDDSANLQDEKNSLDTLLRVQLSRLPAMPPTTLINTLAPKLAAFPVVHEGSPVSWAYRFFETLKKAFHRVISVGSMACGWVPSSFTMLVSRADPLRSSPPSFFHCRSAHAIKDQLFWAYDTEKGALYTLQPRGACQGGQCVVNRFGHRHPSCNYWVGRFSYASPLVVEVISFISFGIPPNTFPRGL